MKLCKITIIAAIAMLVLAFVDQSIEVMLEWFAHFNFLSPLFLMVIVDILIALVVALITIIVCKLFGWIQ